MESNPVIDLLALSVFGISGVLIGVYGLFFLLIAIGFSSTVAIELSIVGSIPGIILGMDVLFRIYFEDKSFVSILLEPY